MKPGFWKIFLAYLIDAAVMFVIVFISSFIIAFIAGLMLASSGAEIIDIETMTTIQNVGFYTGSILTLVYFAVMESSSKRASLGKIVMKLKVNQK
ncbi:putative RDD family membrane protein YckC [Elusimicrobium simillimum]|uniref:RDD family protein n=1 Tax=Elusimicrobium simillimum TaxID=3143438 RepID=UPI003C6F6FE3